MAKPDHPFEYEEGQACPQHGVDSVMGRLIGGIDGEQNHHRDTGGDGEIGGLGHVAVRRGGHKLRKGRKNKRLGHRDAGACRWKEPDPAASGMTGSDKVPVPAKAVNELRKTALSPAGI
jgi:hypothetical protein